MHIPNAGHVDDRAPSSEDLADPSHTAVNSDKDDDLVLSSSTLAALQEFQAEQKRSEGAATSGKLSENWSLSQFWYTDDTALSVAKAVARAAASGSIACVACPSLFRALRGAFPAERAHLLEIDPRFEALGSFSLYDYREPCSVAPELHHTFDIVVADPPYLAAECLEKTAETMRLLAREGAGRFVLLTGAVMRGLAREVLNLRPLVFRPEHSSKLANEFLLYTDVAEVAEELGGWDAAVDEPLPAVFEGQGEGFLSGKGSQPSHTARNGPECMVGEAVRGGGVREQ